MAKSTTKAVRNAKKPAPKKPEQLPDVGDDVRRAYPDELKALERRLEDRHRRFTAGMRERVADWIRRLPGFCYVPEPLAEKFGEDKALGLATMISEDYRDWLVEHILEGDGVRSL